MRKGRDLAAWSRAFRERKCGRATSFYALRVVIEVVGGRGEKKKSFRVFKTRINTLLGFSKQVFVFTVISILNEYGTKSNFQAII